MADSDYTESSSDAANTYAQIVVPKYTLENPVAASPGATTGSSFVRLGSFPSLTDASEQPSGFTDSLALANLVGNTTGDTNTLALAEANDDPEPDDITRESSFAGDANYFLGFSDDTRYRGSDPGTTWIDWTAVSNTTTNRKAETARLLTKGGWWDHSDGNRITTTSGDKVEVIQGNYKMVVLGRQDPTADRTKLAANAFITDVSAGLFEEQGPDPTPCIKTVEYVEDAGVWTLYQDNGTGNVTTKFDGKQCDYYTGTRKESYVGVDHTTDDVHETTAKNLEMVSKTWAQRIESWTGSSDNRVAFIGDKKFAEETEAETNVSGSVTDKLTAGSVTTSKTVAGEINDTVDAGSITVHTTCTGEMKTVVEPDNVWSKTTLKNDWWELVQVPLTKTNILLAGVVTDVSAIGFKGAFSITGASVEVAVSGIKLAADIAILKVQAAVGVNVEIDTFKYSWAQMKGGLVTVRDSMTTLWKTITAPRVDLGLAPPDPAAAAVAQAAGETPPPLLRA